MKFAVCPWAYGNVTTDPEVVEDQPANVYPVLVGAVGAAEILAPVCEPPFVTADPPCES